MFRELHVFCAVSYECGKSVGYRKPAPTTTGASVLIPLIGTRRNNLNIQAGVQRKESQLAPG